MAPRAPHLGALDIDVGRSVPSAHTCGGVQDRERGSSWGCVRGIYWTGRTRWKRGGRLEAGRTFGLVGKDAEDEIREAEQKKRRERQAMNASGMLDLSGYGGAGAAGMGMDAENVLRADEDEADEGRFERFSLSSSLENLLDTQLVKLIWIRRAYGVGWAGAELM
ncbi:hypothetical protein C8R43DRAFT_1136791 [Mycena crocata]|nr:hypothetical protein C8R43DRAFT_1136791 [Mycena crocata]